MPRSLPRVTRLTKSMDYVRERRTFLQVKDTFGLWIAYLVTTSRMRAYSSEELRSADNRVGVL